MFAVVLSVFVIVGLFIHLICSALEDVQHKIKTEARATDKNYQINERKKEGGFTFKRFNCVEGEIVVNGESYPTFNTGTITFGDDIRNVEVDFLVSLDGCFIEDLRICGFTAMSEVPHYLSDEKRIQFLLNIVDKAVDEEIISRKIAKAVRITVNNFLDFSELKEKGVIASIPYKADYVWMGEI